MIDAAALLKHDYDEVRHRSTPRDAILYALGVGLGIDPLALEDLAFLVEASL